PNFDELSLRHVHVLEAAETRVPPPSRRPFHRGARAAYPAEHRLVARLCAGPAAYRHLECGVAAPDRDPLECGGGRESPALGRRSPCPLRLAAGDRGWDRDRAGEDRRRRRLRGPGAPGRGWDPELAGELRLL